MTIEFKWPWTMLPLSGADRWIAHIKEGIKSDNPLYGKKIFPSACCEDKKVILVDNDDDGTYAVLTYENNSSKDFHTDILVNVQDVIKVINEDHTKAMATVHTES